MFCLVVGNECQDTHCILYKPKGVEMNLAPNCAKWSDYILDY